MTELKTSEQWRNQLLPESFVILDPDGWDRKNYQFSFYEEQIDIQEFVKRLFVSTVQCDTKDFAIVDENINKLLGEDK